MTCNKAILLLCSALLISFSIVAQSQTKKYKLLTYGLPDFARQNASAIIEKKWNIEYYGVAGCVVSNELQDSVEKENKEVYKLIEAKYGKDWEAKFYKQIEQEYQIESQIDSLVKSQPYIKDKEIINALPGTLFPMYPSDKMGNYIVNVSTYNRDWKEQKLYKLKVNYKKNVVEIITDYSLSK